ncbi:hypothetical protein [Paraburkholderia sp. XV]|uniref:hypothetical protein n=1 Tax=Paraburkholderia sp. XV TaxID=2831520 RepID=UPI001CD78773|nr:hypothetical protein [Paraburkholderia sp. XV]
MNRGSPGTGDVGVDMASNVFNGQRDSATDIPLRVTIRGVSICLLMILAEGYGVAISTIRPWWSAVASGSGHARQSTLAGA